MCCVSELFASFKWLLFRLTVLRQGRQTRKGKGQDMSEDVKHLRCAKLKGSYVAPSDEFTTERHCACHHLCTSLHLIAPGVECVALIFVSTWQAGVLPCGVCSWYLELLLEGTRLRVRADNFTHSTSMRYIPIHISCEVYNYIESGKFQLMEIHSKKSTFVIVFEDESVLQLVAPCRLVSSIDK